MVSGNRKPIKRKSRANFDVDASSRFARHLLDDLQIPGAVIGRFAVWAWVPIHHQVVTKDLDLAVPSSALPNLRLELERQGLLNRDLTIGGVNARHSESGVNVDFITRSNQEWGDFSTLYAEAVQAAYETNLVYEFEDVVLPLAPPEYIVVMKLATSDREDERDAVRVLRSLSAAVEINEVRDIVTRHVPFLRAKFEQTLREMGHPDAQPLPDSHEED